MAHNMNDSLFDTTSSVLAKHVLLAHLDQQQSVAEQSPQSCNELWLLGLWLHCHFWLEVSEIVDTVFHGGENHTC